MNEKIQIKLLTCILICQFLFLSIVSSTAQEPADSQDLQGIDSQVGILKIGSFLLNGGTWRLLIPVIVIIVTVSGYIYLKKKKQSAPPDEEIEEFYG